MPPKRNYRSWTDETMQNAILAVKGGGMSIWKAAREFGVPKQTISDKINNKWKSNKPGPQTALLEEE